MTSAPASPGATTSAKGPYTIGYSNGGGVGNGFREEQVCTAKAEGTALGTDKIAASPSSIASPTRQASCPTSGR